MPKVSDEIARLRQEYTLQSLDVQDVEEDPFRQFNRWFAAAVAGQLPEPNAMHLATANAAGRPTGRVVLLKDFDSRGFCFYTNYESRKGRQLAENPHAALTFFWQQLERQVRIEGLVVQLEPAESDAYYHTRPRGSQLGAWASPQSQLIQSREVLQNRLTEVEHRFIGKEEINRPPFWGGYRVIPVFFEFWQGRQSRLHDRVAYELQDDESWAMFRLAP